LSLWHRCDICLACTLPSGAHDVQHAADWVSVMSRSGALFQRTSCTWACSIVSLRAWVPRTSSLRAAAPSWWSCRRPLTSLCGQPHAHLSLWMSLVGAPARTTAQPLRTPPFALWCRISAPLLSLSRTTSSSASLRPSCPSRCAPASHSGMLRITSVVWARREGWGVTREIAC
jgi:hypothetical protein